MPIHRSRSATRAATTTAPPNAGRFNPIPGGPPHADDDLIVARGATHTRIGHRADPGSPDPNPACAATTGTRWERYGAYRARAEQISLCRERSCFPRGWAA